MPKLASSFNKINADANLSMETNWNELEYGNIITYLINNFFTNEVLYYKQAIKLWLRFSLLYSKKGLWGRT